MQPKFIITTIAVKSDGSSLKTNKKSVSLACEIELEGVGDFSKYLNEDNLDHDKLLADLIRSQIVIHDSNGI